MRRLRRNIVALLMDGGPSADGPRHPMPLDPAQLAFIHKGRRGPSAPEHCAVPVAGHTIAP